MASDFDQRKSRHSKILSNLLPANVIFYLGTALFVDKRCIRKRSRLSAKYIQPITDKE
jgi:hypothetical protein